jgi:dienelactone hydrolase
VLIVIAVLGAIVLVLVQHLRNHPAAAGTARPRSHLTSAPKRPKKPAPITVGIGECTFVEQGVPTEDYATSTSVPYRRLLTEIRYPTTDGRAGVETTGARPAYGRGPFPWIVFAHGYDTTPDTYKALLDAWTRAGFVVVAPVFPDTSTAGVAAEHGVNTEADDDYQPGDVAFVTRQVLASDRGHDATCPLVKGLLETKSVGLAGQSDGASTVAALAYGSAYRALGAGIPYKAVAALSGEQLYGNDNTYSHKAGDPALLVTQSDTDACNVPENSMLLYQYVDNPDSWFLELLNVAHLPPYTGTAPASFGVVAKVSTQFFQLELDGEQPGAGFVTLGNSAPSVAKMTAGLPGPDIPAVVEDGAACYEN